ncbi:chromosomal replication initiator protein DnaA [Candidatus Gottesmanbacteria bacterium]|nr:chromosomal replication initiator protein DnaA [Candidatus Gottesmanbacteria bacterium]
MDAALWKKTLNEIELQVSKPVYKTIFSQTSLVSLNDGTAIIGCSNPLMINLIETRYHSLLKSILETHTKTPLTLRFIPHKELRDEESYAEPLLANQNTQVERNLVVSSVVSLDEIRRNARINPGCTFENFAVSGTNQMAYAASTAVAQSPGVSYNPLFLYGGVGVGKTHLMMAIANVFFEKNYRARVIYCMGEEFTNEIIQAIRNKTTDAFKRKYRSARLLLLDDVQFIAGKNTVQEEFFYTFNAITQNGGQVVLTSDRPPAEIARLEDRLRSRFEGGLIIDISTPDFELRTAILLIKAKQRNLDLPIEIAKLIAANVTDTRRLEGVLIRLITESELRKVAIDEVLVRSVLGKAHLPLEKKSVSFERALAVVSSFYNLKVSQLKSNKRDRSFSYPRQVLYYILRVELGLPLMTIGELLGGRDHTTIMHGVRKISNELKANSKLSGDIMSIKERFVE